MKRNQTLYKIRSFWGGMAAQRWGYGRGYFYSSNWRNVSDRHCWAGWEARNQRRKLYLGIWNLYMLNCIAVWLGCLVVWGLEIGDAGREMGYFKMCGMATGTVLVPFYSLVFLLVFLFFFLPGRFRFDR